MAELTVARTYGDALFQVAKEQNIIDEIWQDLSDFRKVLEANPDFRKFLTSPAISNEDKTKEVREIFEGQVNGMFLNFLCVLIEKGRVGAYGDIARAYMNIVDEYRHISFGKIYSAVPLTEEQVEQFEQEAGKLLGENIQLRNIVQPDLIGGVSIQVGGRMIDASVKTRLRELSQLLIK